MRQKAKGFLRLLHHRSVIYYANLLTDVLEPLRRLSLSFQSVSATVGDIHTSLQAAVLTIKKYATRLVLVGVGYY